METEKAAFMGKITAGVTHEFQNVLAIVKESAGLLEDLIALTKEDAPLPRERFLRSLTRISEQVSRGVDLAMNLNVFAHTSEEGTTSIDLNRAIAQTAFLCRRFARLRNMTVTALSHEGTSTISTDPLAFQMLLFQCIDLLMAVGHGGSVITVRLEEGNGKRVVISVQHQAGESNGMSMQVMSDGPEWKMIEAAAMNLHMWVQLTVQPAGITIGVSGEKAKWNMTG